MKNNQGITLIALTIMIVVIAILATITTTTGLNVIKESRYNKAIAEMKIMQTKVNEMYDEDKNGIYGVDINTLDAEKKDEITPAYTSVKNADTNIGELTDFRYYSSDYIKNTLDIDGVDGDYIINIKTRTVIYIDGIEIDDYVFYSLDEIEGEQFNVSYTPVYQVKFDANGGKLSQKTKTVVLGEDYGELPTPTREGYTFLGWNGKNKLNLQVEESLPSNTASSNNTRRTFIYNTYVKGMAFNNYFQPSYVKNIEIEENSLKFKTSSGYGLGFTIDAKKNTEYCLSGKAIGAIGERPVVSFLYFDDQGNLIDFKRTDITNTYINTSSPTPSNLKYLVVAFTSSGTDVEVLYSNIQLEEGDVATEYEPYFVTANTKVTQEKDHTLKAIWQEN